MESDRRSAMSIMRGPLKNAQWMHLEKCLALFTMGRTRPEWVNSIERLDEWSLFRRQNCYIKAFIVRRTKIAPARRTIVVVGVYLNIKLAVRKWQNALSWVSVLCPSTPFVVPLANSAFFLITHSKINNLNQCVHCLSRTVRWYLSLPSGTKILHSICLLSTMCFDD